jgi:hypothetical protein
MTPLSRVTAFLGFLAQNDTWLLSQIDILASHSPPSPPAPSFQDAALVAALLDVQAELALQLASVQLASVQLASVQQVSALQVSALQVSLRLQRAEQVARVEPRSPVWQGLAPVSLQAAYEQRAVYLAQDAPVLGSYFEVAPLRQAVLQVLPQRPDEEHTALPQGRLWQLRHRVAVPQRW